jgi:hypothetical protein
MSNYKDKNGQEFIRNTRQYKGTEGRSGNRRRSAPVKGSSLILDDLKPDIMEFITESLENQKELNKIEQQRADIEARTTETIESFITFVKDFIEGDTLADLLNHATASRRRNKTKPLDKKHKKVLKIISKMREENRTYEDIAEYLEKKEIATFSGRGEWHAQTIHRLCQHPEYKDY